MDVDVVQRMTHQYFELRGDTVVFANLRIAKFDFEISDAVSIHEITRAYFPSKEKIKSIPYNLFRKFPFIKTLSMSRCCAQTLSSRRFENALNLETFVFDGNFVDEIDDYTFRGAPILEDMSLCFNGIHYLSIDTFADLSNLTTLHLTGNRLSYINANVFRWLVSLEELLLNQNTIQFIYENTFSENGNLRTLNISLNELKCIFPNVLVNLMNLDYLNLSQNKLTSLITGSIGTLDLRSNFNMETLRIKGYCEELILDRTILKSIHAERWDHLRKISLRRVTSLDISFIKYASNLEEINLSSVGLQNIPNDMFSEMFRLRYLNLNHNKLKILDIDVFLKCRSIEILCLDGNQLTQIDFVKLVDVLKYLKDISFSQNPFNPAYYESMASYFSLRNIHVSRDLAIHTFS